MSDSVMLEPEPEPQVEENVEVRPETKVVEPENELSTDEVENAVREVLQQHDVKEALDIIMDRTRSIEEKVGVVENLLAGLMVFTVEDDEEAKEQPPMPKKEEERDIASEGDEELVSAPNTDQQAVEEMPSKISKPRKKKWGKR